MSETDPRGAAAVAERDRLAEWLDGADVAPDLDRDPDPPQNPAEAERYLRRLARLAAEEAEVEEVYAAEVDLLTRWRDDRIASVHRAAAWLQTALDGWMRARHAEGGTKTLNLPHGTLRLRKPSSRRPVVLDVEPVEQQDALQRVRAVAPQLVRVKLDLDKKAVADLCRPGPDDQAMIGDEVVPHVRFLPTDTRDRFSVEVGS